MEPDAVAQVRQVAQEIEAQIAAAPASEDPVEVLGALAIRGLAWLAVVVAEALGR